MVLSSPAYTIGTGKRSNDIKTGVYYVPGSGAYNPVKNQRINPPSWKIGSASRNPKLIENFPGPGAYENNETKLVILKFYF